MAEYIEREAVIQARGDEPGTWSERDPVEIQEQNDWNYYKHCIEAVPAAEVAEVRHGRWIPEACESVSKRNRLIEYRVYSCSICGRSNGRVKKRYCPNCGALMDGKEDEYENQS